MENEVIRLDDAPETWELDERGQPYCTALEIKYLVKNPTSKADAMAAVLNAAPKVAPNSNEMMGLDNVTFDGFAVTSDKALGAGGMIEATAHYSSRASSFSHSVPNNSFSYNVSMQSVHISTSRRTVAASGVGGATAIDFDNAICVDSETGQVKGVDIQVPSISFTETHHIPQSSFTSAYKRRLSLLVGTVNSGVFRQYDTGEVLFTGVSGARQSGGRYWELTYSFAVSPNEENYTIGSINLGLKRGWEYPWAYYKKSLVGGAIVRKVKYAYIEEIYSYSDFKDIGIGGSDPTFAGLGVW